MPEEKIYWKKRKKENKRKYVCSVQCVWPASSVRAKCRVPTYRMIQKPRNFWGRVYNFIILPSGYLSRNAVFLQKTLDMT
jgi:hypothetical protein